MGRSSIGWRRSATSNTVSNDNTEESYATCHREALARKIGRAENSTRRRNHKRRDGYLALRRRGGVGRHRRNRTKGLGGERSIRRKSLPVRKSSTRNQDTQCEKGLNMNISFENKVALVTGAGSGLGLATAKAFAESGASVVLADWNEQAVRSAAEELAARGHKALAIRCDVRPGDGHQSPWCLELHEVRGAPDAQARKRRYRQLLFDWRTCGRSRSWNISRRQAWSSRSHQSAALEYAAKGIRINAVCPGLIHTPMADQMMAAGQADALNAMLKDVPIGRLGRPDEIADAVLWLCSPVAVDGGFTVH